jgi:hypothetical protein
VGFSTTTQQIFLKGIGAEVKNEGVEQPGDNK